MPNTQFCKSCRKDKDAILFKDGKRQCISCRDRNNKVHKTYRLKPEVIAREKKQALRWRVDKATKRPEYWIYWAAKQRATKYGIDFSISVEDIEIPSHCPILNIQLQRNVGKNGPNSPSLDRIDSNRGYILGNIQVISNKANTMKSNATLEEMIFLGEWAKVLLLEQETPCRTIQV